MGTNYYTKVHDCKQCGRFDHIHLGKSSAGWQFMFQYNGGKFYKNVKEMREWLKDKQIENEYGEQIKPETFWEMVEQKQNNSQNKNHALEMIKSDHSSYYDTVIDGYSFTDSDFS